MGISPSSELSKLETLVSHTGNIQMILFTEKIAPPPPIVTIVPREEAIRKLADDLAQDDRWVKRLIDGLAGVLRDVRH